MPFRSGVRIPLPALRALLACAIAPMVSFAAVARAQTEVLDTLVTLPPVEVRGERTLIPGRSTATTVRLERAALARFLPGTTADALLGVPGLDLVKTGPWASRLSVRGLSGERVLVLVDGVRMNGVRGHGAQPSLVPAGRLEGAEYLPGAGSAQFGSDALGGVVNLVTHRSLFSEALRAVLSLGARAGTPGGMEGLTARVRAGGSRLGLELAGGLGRTRELHAPDGPVPNSGSREEDLSGRLAAWTGPALLDYEHTHYAARDVGLPAFGAETSHAEYPLQSREADRLELTVPGKASRPELRVLAALQTYRSHFTETTVDSVYRFGRVIATRTQVAADRVRTRGWSAEPSLRFPRLGELRVGAELRREETNGPRHTDLTVRDAAGSVTSQSAESGESVPPARREVWSVSAFGAPLARPLRLEAGLRYDVLRSRADSTAGSATSRLDVTDRRWSGEVGASRAFGPVEPYLHLSTGFRAPNLDERYFNGYFHSRLRLFGNPDLRAEHSRKAEAGVRLAETWGGRLVSARLSAYRSEVEDLITFRYIGQLYLVPRFQYFNVERARLDGLEAIARLRFGPASLDLAGTYPRGVDLATGERLLDAGTANATLVATLHTGILPGGSFSVRQRWNDAVRSDDPAFARDSYWTTALEAAALLVGARTVLAVHNLWDASYREPLSFVPESGRTFTVSVRRDFDLPLPFAGDEAR